MFSEFFIDKPRFAGVISIVMILLGLALLMEGALNFITVLTSVKVNHHQTPIVTGSEHEEIK